jgi:hypothetical protein
MQISGETVVATSGKEDWDFVALPGTSTTWVPKWGLTSAPTFDPRFDLGGQFGGWHYGVKAYAGYGGEVGSDGEAKRGPDVNEYCDFAGVFGTGIYVTGVAGTSVNNVGVYGQAGDPPSYFPDQMKAGVLGVGNLAPGVLGISDKSPGMTGVSSSNAAHFGISFLDNGVLGVSGSHGPQAPKTSNIAGVVGTSDRQHGVIGTSNASVGVIGFSNNIGVFGYTTNPQAQAGYFLGDVVIDGNFTVVGFPGQHTKSVAVPFPDGTLRALYCMESPELWFEDFGTAKLMRGRAVVKLDADFGKVIKRGDYRVFLTAEGDCRGLHIRRKSAASFEVRESQGGKSSLAFSYRIVGRRKDIAGPQRFAKVIPPTPLAPAARAPRKPTAAELRAFVASLGKDARARRAKDAMKARRLRALRKRA